MHVKKNIKSTEPKDETIIMKITDLCKKYGDNLILNKINLEIKKGDRIAMIGRSGGGKTTLLRCMNRISLPTSGDIVFGGESIIHNKNLAFYRHKIGFVFQNFYLFPNMTVLKNIILAPLKYKMAPKDQIIARAMELLNEFGLGDKANVYPRKLSGGQKQRVAIIRALINEPSIMLFDEPTSSLDPEMKQEVLHVIKELPKDMAVVLVTHEINFAKNFADKILYLEDGVIAVQGTPKEIMSNSTMNPKLKKFLSEIMV
jgi:polar amino acid transport system ATP-binding protein